MTESRLGAETSVSGTSLWTELWVGCIEGPEPPERRGRLIYRNAGNIVTQGDLSFLAAIDFAVRRFSVARVIVCGHYGCGCLEPTTPSIARQWQIPVGRVQAGNANSLSRLTPEAWAQRVCELNVIEQVLSTERTSVIRDAVLERRALTIEGVVYDPGKDRLLTICSLTPSDGLGIVYPPRPTS